MSDKSETPTPLDLLQTTLKEVDETDLEDRTHLLRQDLIWLKTNHPARFDRIFEFATKEAFDSDILDEMLDDL